jgi:glycosyltransferase involved in cell wall biosynthesis
MLKALQTHCGDVTALGPVEPKLAIAGAILSRALRFLTRKQYLYVHSLWFSKLCGRVIERRLAKDRFDLIAAAYAGPHIAHVETNVPIVFASDATFAAMVDYYPAYSRLLDVSLRQGHTIVRKVFDKSAYAVYPSDWAARSAIRDYGAAPRKVRVIESGANIDPEDVPPRSLLVRKKRSDTLKLLWVGVDWERKGGEIALETLGDLERMGKRAELTICGCTPPRGHVHESMRIVPFLSKNDVEDRKRLWGLFLAADYFLLPSRQETSGRAHCEASAFGLPILAADTGGVRNGVREGENGFVLPPSARGQDYARLIAEIGADESQYRALADRGRTLFETVLNWDTWGRRVRGLIDEL